MKLHRLISLASAIPFAFANDGFEMYGGRKKRRTHGLNSATREQAPRRKGQVRYDENPETTPVEVLISRDEAPPAPKVGGRLKGRSMTQTEEILMLPDRYSVLNFDRNDNEEGIEQGPTVESSWWGRLYVEGFPAPLQFFRAHFGGTPPDGEVNLLLASPITMCDDLSGLAILENDTRQIDNRTVVVAKRGSCTFGDKAIVAHELGAAGILFINNEEGNFHPAAPIAHDLPISAAMITKDDGAQLTRALELVQAANDPGYSLQARYVPLICGDRRAASNSHSYCHPLLPHDQDFIDHLDYKGRMSVEGFNFEYLQGEFGSWIHETDWKTVVPSVIGGDPHCCDSGGFAGMELPDYHAILCQRGECDFITKAENIGSTGAGMLIVSSHNNTIHRMGVDPPHRGRKLNVATAMVGLDAYEHMVDAHYDKLDDGLTSKLAILQPHFSDYSCDDSNDHSFN